MPRLDCPSVSAETELKARQKNQRSWGNVLKGVHSPSPYSGTRESLEEAQKAQSLSPPQSPNTLLTP